MESEFEAPTYVALGWLQYLQKTGSDREVAAELDRALRVALSGGVPGLDTVLISKRSADLLNSKPFIRLALDLSGLTAEA